MQTKLHINLAQGIIDVEGDAELVRSVYEDFRDRLIADGVNQRSVSFAQVEDAPAPKSEASKPTPKPKPRLTPKRKQKAADDSTTSMNADAPSRDKNLNTVKLRDYYAQYSPSNASEKILVFLKFLTDVLEIDRPNTDQIYTCFLEAKEKPPQAFAQAFRDASSKKGFIDFNAADDIVITTKGNNFFEFDLKRLEDK